MLSRLSGGHHPAVIVVLALSQCVRRDLAPDLLRAAGVHAYALACGSLAGRRDGERSATGCWRRQPCARGRPGRGSGTGHRDASTPTGRRRRARAPMLLANLLDTTKPNVRRRHGGVAATDVDVMVITEYSHAMHEAARRRGSAIASRSPPRTCSPTAGIAIWSRLTDCGEMVPLSDRPSWMPAGRARPAHATHRPSHPETGDHARPREWKDELATSANGRHPRRRRGGRRLQRRPLAPAVPRPAGPRAGRRATSGSAAGSARRGPTKVAPRFVRLDHALVDDRLRPAVGHRLPRPRAAITAGS